ncbi:MAG: type II toxin-antitoxin system VapC family toxin [Acidobacteria bacterium]|nr:type II toxin-antitoxin system VapC family toxin [Acidobacteriota bacterium]
MNGSPERLSATAREFLESADNELFLSSASVWEVAIKAASGKLVLPQATDRWVRQRMARNRLTALPIHTEHALRAAALPLVHRDPFDRMLVAQAQAEGLPVLTADSNLKAYDVQVVSAA